MDARQTITSLRRRLKEKDIEIERLRNELACLKGQSCYRVEQQEQATVEHGEWREGGDR